jgi:hypothetical protein
MFESGRRSLVGVASVLALLVGCVDGRTASPPSGPARAEAEADGCLSVLIASPIGDARFTEPIIVEGDQRVFIDPQPVVSCGSMFDPWFDAQRSAPGGRVLRVRLEAAAAEALRAATADYDGKYAVFRWKGEIVSTPRIMSPLHDELVLRHEDQALLEEIAARIRLAPAS